eukprot:12885662-Prorocentrum_lima.AAC.1
MACCCLGSLQGPAWRLTVARVGAANTLANACQIVRNSWRYCRREFGTRIRNPKRTYCCCGLQPPQPRKQIGATMPG